MDHRTKTANYYVSGMALRLTKLLVLPLMLGVRADSGTLGAHDEDADMRAVRNATDSWCPPALAPCASSRPKAFLYTGRFRDSKQAVDHHMARIIAPNSPADLYILATDHDVCPTVGNSAATFLKLALRLWIGAAQRLGVQLFVHAVW